MPAGFWPIRPDSMGRAFADLRGLS